MSNISLKEELRKMNSVAKKLGVTKFLNENFNQEDFAQLNADAQQSTNHPDTLAMAEELAAICTNPNELGHRAHIMFKEKGITDSDVTQAVIDRAGTLLNNKLQQAVNRRNGW